MFCSVCLSYQEGFLHSPATDQLGSGCQYRLREPPYIEFAVRNFQFPVCAFSVSVDQENNSLG